MPHSSHSCPPSAFLAAVSSLRCFAAALTDHGCPPSESSLRPLGKVIHRRRTAIGHLEVSVDVDATGNDHFPVGLDGLHPTGDDQVVSDLPVSGRRRHHVMITQVSPSDNS